MALDRSSQECSACRVRASACSAFCCVFSALNDDGRRSGRLATTCFRPVGLKPVSLAVIFVCRRDANSLDASDERAWRKPSSRAMIPAGRTPSPGWRQARRLMREQRHAEPDRVIGGDHILPALRRLRALDTEPSQASRAVRPALMGDTQSQAIPAFARSSAIRAWQSSATRSRRMAVRAISQSRSSGAASYWSLYRASNSLARESNEPWRSQPFSPRS